MTPLVVDPSGYLKPHHSVGHCLADVVTAAESLVHQAPDLRKSRPRKRLARRPTGNQSDIDTIKRHCDLLANSRLGQIQP